MKKIEEFEKERLEEEIWRIKLNLEAKELKREELLEKYIVKLLYGWDDKKFEEEYLKKLEKNQNRWKKNRKEYEEKEEREAEKYIKEFEGLKWNREDEQMSRIIWGDKKEVPLEVEL